jgi:tetratricopeptide (TPR) repeat protein
MDLVSKTVFISYRRTNVPWALAISQNLSHHGYDVFFDFNGIASGDFEQVILGNIKARAHFVVLLTPSALERCAETTDWLRREIETALDTKRNIVPVMLEGFDFATPGIRSQLTGTLAPLQSYNALRIPAEYFEEGMQRMRDKWLNVALDGVLHPATTAAKNAAQDQQAAAAAAPPVAEKELTAQEWSERAFYATDPDAKVELYSQVYPAQARLRHRILQRAWARDEKGDLEGALNDLDEAIRLKPDYADAFNNRGAVRYDKGDLKSALKDYNEAIRLKPDADAFYNRGEARNASSDLDGALQDYNEAIRLDPDHAQALHNRSLLRKAKGDLTGAQQDYDQAIRLDPNLKNS